MNSFHVIAVETVANCLSEVGSLLVTHSIFDIIRNTYHRFAASTVWLYS